MHIICLLIISIIAINTNKIECVQNFTNNNSNKFRENVYQTRQHKLISFNTDGDLKLDLDFNVPFITLPIKSSMMNMAKSSSLIQFNIGALILTGVIIFGSSVAFPLILALFNKKGFISSSREKQQRSENTMLTYLMNIDNSLLENNVDITKCSQKFLCSMVKKSAEMVKIGKGTSMDKILDGFASNKWFKENLLNFIYKEAIDYGLNNAKNCTKIYGMSCDLSYDKIWRVFNGFFIV